MHPAPLALALLLNAALAAAPSAAGAPPAGATAPSAASATAPGAPAAAAPRSARDSPRLMPNERMEFSIDYKGIRLGRAQLFLGEASGSVIPVILQTRTTGIAAVVTLRQQLSSHLDRETGLPRSLSLDAVEGNYRHVDTTSFDRESNKATVHRRGKAEHTWVVDVPPGTIDFLAMVYRLRELPLVPEARHPFDVLAGRTVSRVEAEVVGRENVSTDIGDFEALKVRVPTSFEGKFQEEKPTFIWFSDDSRRIVVRITTEFGIGRATATLISYSPGTPASAEP